tara:strand:+ start:345 stop:2021 length:1677 start_codon:yes stop_codon:yes gene_type:complete
MQRYTQSQSLLDLLALQKLKSEKEAAMRNMQTQMQPPMNTVRDQREQQVLDMTRNEVAQQAMQGGQQLALNKQREMQARGLPAQAAPNMQGMADGGIVGYQEGGFMGPPEANMLQRMGQGLKNYGANAQESMGILKEAKAGMGIPYGERSAVMKQVRDEIEAQNQNRDPNFIERMGQKLMDTGLDVEESKAILKKFYNNMGKTYEEMSNGMADGGIVGLQTGGTGEDKMRELGIDPDYGFLDALGAPFQFFGDKFKEGSLAAAEFLGDVMPGGGSVGRERMAEQKATEAVEAAYPDASAGDVRAITKMIMVNDEELPPPAVDTDRVRAEQYMGSDQQVDDMMSDIYRGVEPEAPASKGDGLAGLAQAMTPSRLQELRNRREGIMGGITSPERLQRDKLRAYVSGLGQTGLGGGAEAFTREQQRQDALQIGDLDRLIELEREDEKLQREINASMAEVVANNEAELVQLLMNTSLKDRLEQAGDRRGFISDVLKQVQKDSIMNPALMALEEAKKEGDITRDAYETQRLSIIMDMISGLPAGYDIETGLGGSVDFTQGTFD